MVKENHIDVVMSTQGELTYVNLCKQQNLTERRSTESRAADKPP